MNYIKKFQNSFDVLPNQEDIIKLIYNLRKLIFPGFFDNNENFNTIQKEVIDILNKQIYCASIVSKKKLNEKELTNKFIMELPHIIELLKTDLSMAYSSDPAANDINEIIISYPGLFAITIYRLAHYLYVLNIPYLPRMMTEFAHSKTGIDIHPGAEIGSYFFIDHGTGIVIGETSIIGNHVKIYQGVTLGALSLKRGQKLKGLKRHPTIGNNVTIYACASILGGDTIIGDNVIIGSNTYILSSIPSNTIVRLSKIDMEFISK